jgi:membrane peptidoglycan carboxypeptidase
LAFEAGRTDLLCEYLNSVYFGRSYVGVAAAARGYFRCTALDLSRAQSLFLAERIALPNSFRLPRIRNIVRRKAIRRMLGADIMELPLTYAMAFGDDAGGKVRQLMEELGQT